MTKRGSRGSQSPRGDRGDRKTRGEKLLDALQSATCRGCGGAAEPEFANFSIGDGTLGDLDVEFLVAEGEDEEEDRPVALILSPKLMERLEPLLDEVEGDEDDDDEEGEEEEDGDEDEPRRWFKP